MTGRVSAMDIFPPERRVVISQQGTTRTIQVAGAWGSGAHERLRDAIAQALGSDPESLVLDLSAATSIDLSGVALVVALTKRCRCQQVRLIIVPGPIEVQRLFRTYLDDLPFVGGP